MKVQQAASQNDMEPKDFCDETAEKFKELANLTNISYDRFIRTTDPDHIQAVEHFWLLLRQKGYIYETKHEGWYSVSDECFYPESEVIKYQEPFTGAVYMAAAESKTKVEWVEEKNYCFRMTELKDRLLEFYSKNPDWIEPAYRMNEVIDWVKNHLEDLSISRPVQRLSWGIPVPDDPSQTIYVWVDALINYLTASGFPAWPPGESHKGGWPADVHVLGKDILRFHCIYWPALLMALDLPLPKKMLIHSHWTLNKRKMSKSLGNVVNPLYAINRWGVDTMRFYLLFEGGIADDADYNNNTLVVKYKKYLQGGLGNLTNRLTKTPAWDLRNIIEASSKWDESSTQPSQAIQEFVGHYEARFKELAPVVARYMDDYNPVAAIRHIIDTAGQVNELLSQTQPWSLIKTEDPVQKANACKVLFTAAEGLRISGILLQAFLPGKAPELLDRLGVAPDKRTFEHAVFGCDYTYGLRFLKEGSPRNTGLFPPLVEDKNVQFQGGKKVAKGGGHNEILVTED